MQFSTSVRGGDDCVTMSWNLLLNDDSNLLLNSVIVNSKLAIPKAKKKNSTTGETLSRLCSFYERAMLRTWVGTQVLMTPEVQRSNWLYRRVLLPPIGYYLCGTEIIVVTSILNWLSDNIALFLALNCCSKTLNLSNWTYQTTMRSKVANMTFEGYPE